METVAQITAEVDGTPGDNDMPGRLLFKTTADDSNTATEGLRITSDKIVNIAGQGSVFGRLNVPIPTQSGGSAIQVMNTASGSGDGTLTNIVLRSVNSAGNQWSHSQYRSQSHQFQVQTDNKITINSNGLCFNSDTAAANALHDYEEGTWTPVLNNAGGFGTDNTVGKYVKIGRLVTFIMQISGVRDSSSASGTFHISGLPFTADNSTGGHGYAGCMGALYNWNIPNTAYQIGIRVADSNTFIQLFANFDNAADAQLTTPFDANKTIFGSLAGSYYTDS